MESTVNNRNDYEDKDVNTIALVIGCVVFVLVFCSLLVVILLGAFRWEWSSLDYSNLSMALTVVSALSLAAVVVFSYSGLKRKKFLKVVAEKSEKSLQEFLDGAFKKHFRKILSDSLVGRYSPMELQHLEDNISILQSLALNSGMDFRDLNHKLELFLYDFVKDFHKRGDLRSQPEIKVKSLSGSKGHKLQLNGEFFEIKGEHHFVRL